MKGVYVLVLQLSEDCVLSVGRLGRARFPAGTYLYAGSAMGPGGLIARLARHCRDQKRHRWHIDYLRDHAPVRAIWYRVTDEKVECQWAAAAQSLPSASAPVPGFGSSDCTCRSHLVHLASPDATAFCRLAGIPESELRIIAMEEMLDALLRGNEDEKEAAATALMKAGQLAVPGLQTVLAAGNADARWWATRALAEIPGREAQQSLLATLADPDEDVRVCAVMALGERHDKTAVQPLLALMADGGGYLQRHIGDALSKIGDPAVPGLVEALQSQAPVMRANAARALIRIESEAAIPALIQALDDPEPAVEHYAWEALQRMGVGTMVFFKP